VHVWMGGSRSLWSAWEDVDQDVNWACEHGVGMGVFGLTECSWKYTRSDWAGR